MEYIKLFWKDAPLGEPSIILYEVDTENERLALRSIDILQMDIRTILRISMTALLKSYLFPLWKN